MEVITILLGLFLLWILVLATLVIIAKGLWIANPLFDDAEFTVKMRFEGVDLPSEDVTKEIRDSLRLLQISVGFSLVIISVFGTIILMEIPAEFVWVGVLLFSIVPVLGYKALKSLKKINKG